MELLNALIIHTNIAVVQNTIRLIEYEILVYEKLVISFYRLINEGFKFIKYIKDINQYLGYHG